MKITTMPLLFTNLLGLALMGTYVVDADPEKIVKTPPPTTSPVATIDNIVANVYGGSTAQPGQYPYFVQFLGCGGALIAPDIVLSAAHCGDRTGQDLYIGAYRTQSTDNGAKIRTCVQWIGHPDYDSVGVNDVSLCKLDSPVTIDQTKVKLQLNRDAAFSIIGEDLEAMGFGYLDGNYNTPTFLQRTDLQGRDCGLGPLWVCAGGHDDEDGKTDVCRGDSGGPLVRVIKQSDGPAIHYHVGAVSSGALCPEATTGFYASTSGAISWIDRTMCQMNSVDCKDGSDDSESEDDNNDGSDCEENESKLVIKVLTDFYSYENEWLLEKFSGDQWLEVKKEDLGEDNTEFTTNMCLDKNTSYKWTITDTHGDGLCDPFGNCGSISITLEGKTLLTSNGVFGYDLVKKFRTPSQNENENENENDDKWYPDCRAQDGKKSKCKSMNRCTWKGKDKTCQPKSCAMIKKKKWCGRLGCTWANGTCKLRCKNIKNARACEFFKCFWYPDLKTKCRNN